MPPEKTQSDRNLSNGWIYVQDPEGGAPFFTRAADTGIGMTFNDASDCARQNNARLATPHEMNVMFNLRAGIGGFAEEGAPSETRYWTSYKIDDTDAMVQDFGSGFSTFVYQRQTANLRLVMDA